jgi:PhnB protein
MELVTYLMFDGNCKEAFKFYEKALGGEIIAMFTHGESPMGADTTPELRDKIMHAAFKVENALLYGTDGSPNGYTKPQGFSVSLGTDDVARAERIFAALAEGGTVRMPMQKTFWAERFGDVVDRFGVPWMISGGPMTPG